MSRRYTSSAVPSSPSYSSSTTTSSSRGAKSQQQQQQQKVSNSNNNNNNNKIMTLIPINLDSTSAFETSVLKRLQKIIDDCGEFVCESNIDFSNEFVNILMSELRTLEVAVASVSSSSKKTKTTAAASTKQQEEADSERSNELRNSLEDIFSNFFANKETEAVISFKLPSMQQQQQQGGDVTSISNSSLQQKISFAEILATLNYCSSSSSSSSPLTVNSNSSSGTKKNEEKEAEKENNKKNNKCHVFDFFLDFIVDKEDFLERWELSLLKLQLEKERFELESEFLPLQEEQSRNEEIKQFCDEEINKLQEEEEEEKLFQQGTEARKKERGERIQKIKVQREKIVELQKKTDKAFEELKSRLDQLNGLLEKE